ncbi:MAG: CAP domain-containing protein [Deltaproteobacteria bacterium]|nr:CAP domain-containing protein [Deltaproteobacteria bacterium]
MQRSLVFSLITLYVLVLWSEQTQRPQFTNTYNPRVFSHTLKKEESNLFSIMIGLASDNYREYFEIDGKLCAASRYLSLLYAKKGEVPKRVETTALRPLLWSYGVYDFQYLPTAFVYKSEDSLKESIKTYIHLSSKRGLFMCGVGIADFKDERRIATIICSKRIVYATDIPKIMTEGSYLNLSFGIRSGYKEPIIYYSPPSGGVYKARPAVNEKGEFYDSYKLDGGLGKYLVQIIAKGPTGAEPIFLIPIYVNMDISDIKKELMTYVNLEDHTKTVSEEEAKEMLYKAINFERKKLNIAPVKLNTQLSQIAFEKSKMMAEKQLFGHEVDSKKTEEILRSKNIRFSKMAENIGLNSSPRMAHFLFMSSPAHRASILDPAYSEVGIGIYKVGDEEPQWFITEIFIVPMEF